MLCYLVSIEFSLTNTSDEGKRENAGQTQIGLKNLKGSQNELRHFLDVEPFRRFQALKILVNTSDIEAIACGSTYCFPRRVQTLTFDAFPIVAVDGRKETRER